MRGPGEGTANLLGTTTSTSKSVAQYPHSPFVPASKRL